MADPDPLEELRGFNSRNLYEKLLNMSDSVFEDWHKEKQLIWSVRTGPECNGNMGYDWSGVRIHPKWKCTRYNCRKSLGFFAGSWFEGTHLTCKEVNFIYILRFCL